MTVTRCSVVVTNFNYADFLREAVDSALSQTWPETEVVVVDDGSTDDSRAVLASYGDQIVSVLQPNGGQASALNVGLDRCHGDIVLFLDADDVLLEDALEAAVDEFEDDRVVKVHWPMAVVDADGVPLGRLSPPGPLPSGDESRAVLGGGPTSSLSPPTSGNAWRRQFLEAIFPVPTAAFRLCADEYLYNLAPAFGHIATIDRPLSLYRQHGGNNYASLTGGEKLALEVASFESQCEAMADALGRNGMVVDIDAWHAGSWFHRLERAVIDITNAIPAGARFVLVDDYFWEVTGLFGDRVPVAMGELTADGGNPKDEIEAMTLVPALSDHRYLVFGWPSFWWFDHYPTLIHRLAEGFDVVAENDVVRILERRSARRVG